MPFPYRSLEDLPESGGGASPAAVASAVALGVFDGVHRGHQALLAAMLREAASSDASEALLPAVLTFHPHPTALFAPDRVPPLLCTLEERAELLRAYGAQLVVVARFDAAFAGQSPEEFVRNVLVDRLCARAVVVGEDFRYGRGRAGDAATLTAAGGRFGFSVQVVPTVTIDGVPARSSEIRRRVAAGQVAEASVLLGRPFTLRGPVVHGRKLGRTIGFPTANVLPDPAVLIPGPGVYAGRACRTSDGSWHRAAISVGTNPTVAAAGAPSTVEAYLLDGFTDDLYGETLVVEFGHYLRGMEKFASLEGLIAQMAQDINRTMELIPVPAT